MLFINKSQIIGKIIDAGSHNLTGSEVGTLVMIMLSIFLFGAIFRLPLIMNLLLMTPFVIVLMAFYSAPIILITGGIFLFVIAGILTKMFFLT